MKIKPLVASAIALAMVTVLAAACGSSGSGPVSAADEIAIGAPACAHCLAMAVLPQELGSKYKTSFQSFTTLQAAVTGVSSGKLDIAQVDYTGLISMLSKGLPVTAISGQVNGGSDLLARKGLDVKPNDWNSLKALVRKDLAAGQKLKIGTEFGTVQDIETRLQLPVLGINPNTDVDMVNVPSQGAVAALANGSVDLDTVVQPFAASALVSGDAFHFEYPYDQPAGNLTNVVVVNNAWAKAHPDLVEAVAAAMSKLVKYLPTSAGQKDWVNAIEQYTSVSKSAVTTAVAQLSPDIKIPFSQVQAVANAMYQRKLISQPLTPADLEKSINYTWLEKATGDSASQLGAPAN